MGVTPMLGDWEVPRVAFLRMEEARKLAEFAVPTRGGSVYQDLGATAAVVEIAGAVFGPEERSAFLTGLRERMRAAEPLTFVADIAEATDIQFVLVESLVVEEHGVRPDEIAYRLRLRESPPPPPPPDPLGGIDGGLLDAASGFVAAAGAALDALEALGNIPDFSDPSALLGGTADGVKSALSALGDIGPKLNALFGDG